MPHAPNPAPSNSHSNLARSDAADENPNVADAEFDVVPSGPDVNDTDGAVTSTENDTVADEPVLPAASVCDADTDFTPSVRPVNVAVHEPLETATVCAVLPVIDTVTSDDSLAVPDTVTDAEPSVDPPAGEVTDTTGAVRSTVHERVATVEMFPAASTARTLNV